MLDCLRRRAPAPELHRSRRERVSRNKLTSMPDKLYDPPRSSSPFHLRLLALPSSQCLSQAVRCVPTNLPITSDF